MPAQGVGKGLARFDCTFHLIDGRAKFCILGLAAQNIETLNQRQARFDHGGELTGKDNDFFLLDAAHTGDIDFNIFRFGLHSRHDELTLT